MLCGPNLIPSRSLETTKTDNGPFITKPRMNITEGYGSGQDVKKPVNPAISLNPLFRRIANSFEKKSRSKNCERELHRFAAKRNELTVELNP